MIEKRVIFNVVQSVIRGKALFMLWSDPPPLTTEWVEFQRAGRFDAWSPTVTFGCVLIPEWAAEEISQRWGGHNTAKMITQLGDWQLTISDIGKDTLTIDVDNANNASIVYQAGGPEIVVIAEEDDDVQ